MDILSLNKVSQYFPASRGKKLAAIQDVNLKIRKGEFFVFVGPSGSGKSTILRIMSGLEKSFTGELKTKISMADMGFVFQQFALLPWLTVYENIEFNLLSSGLSEKERKEAVDEEIRKMGLEKFAHERPRALSGGMKQRVGIARALVKNPKVLFMDEPFSELDSFTAEELRVEINKIWLERKLTIIMVTHIIEDAVELADRIAVLTPRPGKIEAIVENTVPRPRKKRSKEFFQMEDKLYALIKGK